MAAATLDWLHQSLAQPWSEGILMLVTMGVDPDDVGEVVQALRARSAPAAVSHATHGRVDLVVYGRRVHIDDARKNLRRHFKRLVGIAGQDRRGQSIHRPVGRL